MQTTAFVAAFPGTAFGTCRRPAGRAQLALRLTQQQMPRGLVAAQALGDSSKKQKGIRREDEPDEYWASKDEREGKSPFQDPLAQIGILAIFFPFIFLALAIAFGWVDLSGGRL
ncbi:hypothetical protein ABPG77_002407 [Micractinium sp. CCAP 211/92]